MAKDIILFNIKGSGFERVYLKKLTYKLKIYLDPISSSGVIIVSAGNTGLIFWNCPTNSAFLIEDHTEFTSTIIGSCTKLWWTNKFKNWTNPANGVLKSSLHKQKKNYIGGKFSSISRSKNTLAISNSQDISSKISLRKWEDSQRRSSWQLSPNAGNRWDKLNNSSNFSNKNTCTTVIPYEEHVQIVSP